LTPAQEEVRSFAESVTGDLDMPAVLRGHLYLERAMFALLLQSEPGREKHFKRLKFSKKVAALEAKGIVSADVIAGIRAINDIRNEFAHELERINLTAEDDKAVETTTTGALRFIMENLVSHEPPHRPQRGRVRLVIIILYALLRKAHGVSVRI
jgi:hypothetical protein